MLIHVKGSEHSNTILALAGAIFVIPFLLFASTAGSLADRYSKKTLVFVTRIAELCIVFIGVIAFALKSAFLGYSVLFLMATQSSIFSPAKYGIIPEIVKKQKISHYNGVITATTYLAIIIGTFLGSFLTDITAKNFILASFSTVIIAICGFLFSFGIPKTKPQAREKKVSTKFLSDIYRSLRKSLETRYLFFVLIFGAYFLFLGSYTQLNIIPYAMQSLGLSEIEGGYLFLMTAIGIGIGSFLAGRLSGRDAELGFIPLSALGITFLTLFLFIFSFSLPFVVLLLVLMGFLGGFYIVPVDAFIQTASPDEDRGANVATSNFLSFTGVVLSSGLLALLGNGFGLTAAQGFLVIGMITFLLTIILCLAMADQVLRLIVSSGAHFFWKLTIKGRKNLRLLPPALLIGERTSWLDTIIVMATLPRMIRYIVPIYGRFVKGRSFIYRLLRLIPIDIKHFSLLGDETLEEVKKELKKGHSVCLMLPVELATEELNEWEAKIESLLERADFSIIPIHIIRTPPKENATLYQQLKTLFDFPITVAYGNKQEYTHSTS
ncbi:MAG: MFS transporter [Chlamydiia bacterium]|nr:MFS transporter [Chlamydiia bacterium]